MTCKNCGGATETRRLFNGDYEHCFSCDEKREGAFSGTSKVSIIDKKTGKVIATGTGSLTWDKSGKPLPVIHDLDDVEEVDELSPPNFKVSGSRRIKVHSHPRIDLDDLDFDPDGTADLKGPIINIQLPMAKPHSTAGEWYTKAEALALNGNYYAPGELEYHCLTYDIRPTEATIHYGSKNTFDLMPDRFEQKWLDGEILGWRPVNMWKTKAEALSEINDSTERVEIAWQRIQDDYSGPVLISWMTSDDTDRYDQDKDHVDCFGTYRCLGWRVKK